MTGKNDGLIPVVKMMKTQVRSDYDSTINKLMVEELFEGVNMTYARECWRDNDEQTDCSEIGV